MIKKSDKWGTAFHIVVYNKLNLNSCTESWNKKGRGWEMYAGNRELSK